MVETEESVAFLVREEGLTLRVFDAFVRGRDGFGLATIVGQYEGFCEDQYEVMALAALEAGYENATSWLEAAKGSGCAVCALSKWEAKNLAIIDAKKKERVARQGERLWCTFRDLADEEVREKQVLALFAPKDFAYKRWGSTFIAECEVPLDFRERARSGQVSVSVTSSSSSTNLNRMPLRVFEAVGTVDVAACSWASAEAFLDRDGNWKAQGLENLREWLAAHLAFGIDYFLVMESDATWTDPRESKLWPVMAPLVESNLAGLVPWPKPACGARHDGPWASLQGTQRLAFSAQSFFGRPTQYAAQNACHRRLRFTAKWVTHLDVDEFAFPGGNFDTLIDAMDSVSHEEKGRVASVGLPHIFYAPCSTLSEEESQNSPFAEDGPPFCAGKAVPSRVKQIASTTDVDYIWDHYVRIRAPGTRLVTASASTGPRLLHARRGYGFSDAASARFASVLRKEDLQKTPQETRTFEAKILPRLQLDCSTKNNSSFVCGKKQNDSFCWCRDRDIDRWRPKIADVRRQIWNLL